MNKIYLTLLALIALLGAQSASADVYTVFSTGYNNVGVWGGGYSSAENISVHWTISNAIRVFYGSNGFTKGKFKPNADNRKDETAEITFTDLHLYDGASDKGALKINVNGTAIDFSTRNGQVYSTASQTMNGTSAEFTIGFTDGTWYRMIADGNVTVGEYVSIKRDDNSNKSSFSLSNGSKYHFELNTANMQIKVVQESGSTEPETDKWSYMLDGGSKTEMTKSGDSWTYSADFNQNEKIGFYKNDNSTASCYESNGDYYLNGAVSSKLLKNNMKWFVINKAGTYTFTITGDNMEIGYKAIVNPDEALYLFYSDGKDNWQSAVTMPHSDLGGYTVEVSLGDGSYFVPANSTTLDWNNATNRYGAPSNDCNIAQGQTMKISLGNGNVFYVAASGKYRITVKDDKTTVSISRVGDYVAGGGSEGNWEGAGDISSYPTSLDTSNIEYITPTASEAGDPYFITFEYTEPKKGEKLTQKLTATHSVKGGELVWMKYESTSWKGENNSGQLNNVVDNNKKVEPADALYLSDTHLYSKGPRGASLQTSKYMKDYNSLDEMIESRTHCVHHTSEGVHVPRNFTQAFYRVYGSHAVNPVAQKMAKSRSNNARAIKAVIDSNHGSRYGARVAYTAEVEDNTSGVTGIEVDKPVIGENGQDAAPVYYNLQGVKVSRPTAGQVYIVKRGDKVTKEVIK